MTRTIRIRRFTSISVEIMNNPPITPDVVDMESDPSEMFDRKVEDLADLLGCSEAEATSIILNRINGTD